MAKMTSKEVSKTLYDKSCEIDTLGVQYWQGKASGLYEAAEIVRDNLCETEQQSRERFEAWRISQCDERVDLRRDANGDYEDDVTRAMHLAWQASQSFTEASK